jgi:hypothetical protein
MIHQELITFTTTYHQYGEIDPTGSCWILRSMRIRFSPKERMVHGVQVIFIVVLRWIYILPIILIRLFHTALNILTINVFFEQHCMRIFEDCIWYCIQLLSNYFNSIYFYWLCCSLISKCNWSFTNLCLDNVQHWSVLCNCISKQEIF